MEKINESIENILVEALPTLQTVDAENNFINDPTHRWVDRLSEVGRALPCPAIKLKVHANTMDTFYFNTRTEPVTDDEGNVTSNIITLVADFRVVGARIVQVNKPLGLVNEIVLDCQNKDLKQDRSENPRTYNVHLSDLFNNRGEVIVRNNPANVQSPDTKGYLAASVLNVPRVAPFVDLLRELSVEKLLQIQARKGRGNAARGIRVKDYITSLSAEDKQAVKDWFYTNVEQIVYYIPAGDISDTEIASEYDLNNKNAANIIDRINEKFLNLQQSIIDKLHLTGIDPDYTYTSADDVTIGHNIYLTWRAVTECSEEKSLERYDTHWGNSCKIYFNRGVDISQVPEVVAELFKTAKAENPEATGAIKGNVISSIPLANALILDVFEDINFLAGHPEVACKRESVRRNNNVINFNPEVEAEEAPLNQEFPEPTTEE